MKKIIALILMCAMVLSMTACSWHQGNPEKQESELLEFVKKYYGEAEVVEKDVALLDTATIFLLKDKQDGFTYPITAMEVYMSDLGFVSDTEGSENTKTIVFDGQFTLQYVANLAKNKIPAEEYNSVVSAYDALLDMMVFEYEQTSANMFTVLVNETSLMMTSSDTEAITAIAQLMEKYDERKVLNYYVMPIYQAKIENDEPVVEYNEDGSAKILGYYDFFFDYFMTPEEFDGVTMMHDYFVDSKYQNIKIRAVSNDIPSTSVTLEEGFSFAPTTETSGTFIIVEIDGKLYEFYTLMGYKGFNGEHDEYGIYDGSFLDMIAPERIGNKDVMVAYYSMMYPSIYTNLTLHFKPVESATEETPEVEEHPSADTNTEEDATE